MLVGRRRSRRLLRRFRRQRARGAVGGRSTQKQKMLAAFCRLSAPGTASCASCVALYVQARRRRRVVDDPERRRELALRGQERR